MTEFDCEQTLRRDLFSADTDRPASLYEIACKLRDAERAGSKEERIAVRTNLLQVLGGLEIEDTLDLAQFSGGKPEHEKNRLDIADPKLQKQILRFFMKKIIVNHAERRKKPMTTELKEHVREMEDIRQQVPEIIALLEKYPDPFIHRIEQIADVTRPGRGSIGEHRLTQILMRSGAYELKPEENEYKLRKCANLSGPRRNLFITDRDQGVVAIFDCGSTSGTFVLETDGKSHKLKQSHD